MDKFKRPVVWVPIAVAVFVLTLVAGAGGAYFALRPSSDSGRADEGFIAHGRISALMIGVDGYTSDAKQCSPATTRVGTVQEGTPVSVSLDGTVVATGELGPGQYKENGQWGGICSFEFSVSVGKIAHGEGRYSLDVLGHNFPTTYEKLRDGYDAVNL